jgi:FMN phosphatase YigB (HAD superfamily)
VISADDVDTLLFDVLGTVVDEAGSMRAELAAALDRLALDPRRTLMVAAHPWDLRAAAAQGLHTAFIQRAGEGVPEPSDRFDLAVPDLAALAAGLVTKA